MNTDELIEAVKKWGRDREINNPIMQYAKVIEETGEIAHEITRGKYKDYNPDLKDAFGDTLVTLIILADILGYDIVDCLNAAYNEIAPRQGKTINGSFVKDTQ